jgi:hypothetical protein
MANFFRIEIDNKKNITSHGKNLLLGLAENKRKRRKERNLQLIQK